MKAERHELIRLTSCDSTNDYLKRPLPGSIDSRLPVFALAERQTAGRGRLGRGWSSPNGGVYLSLLLPEPTLSAEAACLPLVAALAALAACQPLTGMRLAIKWPNDILAADGRGRRKLAGILVELHEGRPLIGVGVNVYREESGAPRAPRAPGGLPKAWLADGSPAAADPTQAQALLEQAAQALIDQLMGYIGRWQSGGRAFAPFAAEYRAALLQTGEWMEVRDATGAVVAVGEVEGVDDEGRLLLRDSGSLRRVASGELTTRRPDGET